MELLIKILLNAAALFAAAYLLRPNVQVRDFGRAVIIAVVLAILNGTLGAFLKMISFPITILTLGLFSLVINALMIILADYFLKGFQVRNFWWALVLSALLAIFNWLLYSVFL
ncbi:MAG: phage holin family protein [Lewinellaceae bacterium]|nr:phage holin family protein [Lewinellaceae bacterium]